MQVIRGDLRQGGCLHFLLLTFFANSCGILQKQGKSETKRRNMATPMRRKREQKFCVANEIVTNNLRGYYMERFRSRYKYNIKQFAQDCGVSYTSMEGYLMQGKMPRYQTTLEQIEDRLGKERYDVFVDRELVEWNASECTWAHPDRRGMKKQHEPDYSMVAEPIEQYAISTCNHAEYCRCKRGVDLNILKKHLIEAIPEEYLFADDVIRDFISATFTD